MDLIEKGILANSMNIYSEEQMETEILFPPLSKEQEMFLSSAFVEEPEILEASRRKNSQFTENGGDLSNWTECFRGDDSPSRFTIQLSQVNYFNI